MIKKIKRYFQNIFWKYTINEIDNDLLHIQYHLDYGNVDFVKFYLKMYIYKYSGNYYPKFIQDRIKIFEKFEIYYKKTHLHR